jgi:hypothetical protein
MPMQKRLHMQTIGMLSMLAIQFILGMLLNLFVSLPDKHPGTTGNEYFNQSGHSYIWAITGGGGVALFLHALVATFLLLGSIGLLINALRSHDKRWVWIGVIGFLGTSGAFANGLSFLDFNHDFSSFIMAVGFTIAAVAYVIGLLVRPKSAAHTTKG